MRKTRKKKRSYKRILLLIVIILLVCSCAYSFFHKGNFTQRAPEEEGMMPADNAVHVMIMGVDSRVGDYGRSDTLMVASLDENTDKIYLLSIPRDTRVQIEGNGYDKINHAYAFGGHKLSQKTVEKVLGVPMDYYVVVDIKAFERIIDAIGGIDIDVEKRMYYEDPWDDNGGLVIDLYPGEQHMDGEKAIQYVRYRDEEGDIGRISRQQKFMQAVLDKVISPQILPRLPEIIRQVSSAVETDMSVSDMISFAGKLKQEKDNGLQTAMLPGWPATYKEVNYWIPDIKKLRTMLADNMGLKLDDAMSSTIDADVKQYESDIPKGMIIEGRDGESFDGYNNGEKSESKDSGKEDSEADITVRVINSSGINGAGAKVADILRKKGFNVSEPENGSVSDREQTTITAHSSNTDKFYGMPFKCVIMSGGSKHNAVVNIGRDFRLSE